eukprot:gene37185-50175_t
MTLAQSARTMCEAHDASMTLAGMDELFEQSRNIFVGDSAEAKTFTKQIAFNVIPHIDSFLEDGSTKEEWKMVVETKKILDPKIKVTATSTLPVFEGSSPNYRTLPPRQLALMTPEARTDYFYVRTLGATRPAARVTGPGVPEPSPQQVGGAGRRALRPSSSLLRPAEPPEALDSRARLAVSSAGLRSIPPAAIDIARRLRAPGLSGRGFQGFHVVVGQAEVMADLVDQHMRDDRAEAFVVLGPIIEDRPPVEPDRV